MMCSMETLLVSMMCSMETMLVSMMCCKMSNLALTLHALNLKENG